MGLSSGYHTILGEPGQVPGVAGRWLRHWALASELLFSCTKLANSNMYIRPVAKHKGIVSHIGIVDVQCDTKLVEVGVECTRRRKIGVMGCEARLQVHF